MRTKQDVVIINYGMGNVGSVANMLKHIGCNAILSNNIKDIEKADKLILPGVGHFSKAMENLKEYDLLDVITNKAMTDKTPLLGICLGMQLLCKSSEEGHVNGIGLINAKVKKFDFSEEKNLKIPHMGWNITNVIRSKESIFKDIAKPARFYFVHSYYVECDEEDIILTDTVYGHSFTSAFSKDNIFGVQFHPEKSHQYGITLFENFLKL